MFPSLHAPDGGHEDREQVRAVFGQKGAYLRFLCAQGARVPPGFIVSCEHAQRLVERDALSVAELDRALSMLCAQLGPSASLAIRSSPTYSLPGALLSVLNLTAGDAAAPRLERVLLAIDSVLDSARSKPAVDQRAAMSVYPASGPQVAVVVQVMLDVESERDFGAVALSHDPATGERGLLGELAPGQPAAAVVQGRKRPQPLSRRHARPGQEGECLETREPTVHAALAALCARFSDSADEPLEFELVFARGQLWFVEARPLVLSPRAKLVTLLSALDERRACVPRLLSELYPQDLGRFVELRIAESSLAAASVIARGLAASPGVVTGRLVFDIEEAIRRGPSEPVVLVRRDALPEDVAAFRAACAVITTSGGLTSHASVIARGLRIAAVIGCSELRLDARAACLRLVNANSDAPPVAQSGDLVTVDGHRGLVLAGEVAALPVVATELAQICAHLKGMRGRQLFAIGPSASGDHAYEQCALDGVWDAQHHTHVRGSEALGAITIHDNLPTDSSLSGQSPSDGVACRPGHAAAWALFLARERR